jgi:hypothetical protein
MTNSPSVRNSRSYTTIAAAIIIAAVVISAAIFTSSALRTTKTVSTTTTTTSTTTDTFVQTITVLSTVSSASCDYVIPGPCPNGQTFALSVNYSGSWTVTYQGYNDVCGSTCANSSLQTLLGSYDGSGFNSRNITVGGQGNGWTFCAQAQKSDASTSTLTLGVAGSQNKTSLPFGTTSACVISEEV